MRPGFVHHLRDEHTYDHLVKGVVEMPQPLRGEVQIELAVVETRSAIQQ